MKQITTIKCLGGCGKEIIKRSWNHNFCPDCAIINAKEYAKSHSSHTNYGYKDTWGYKRPDTVHRSTVWRRAKKMGQVRERGAKKIADKDYNDDLSDLVVPSASVRFEY